MVPGRAVRKTEFSHGCQIDPILLCIKDFPQILDVDIFDQFLALLNDLLKGIDHLIPAQREIQACFTFVQQTSV